jgi:NitT/TauT family transport system permease protein
MHRYTDSVHRRHAHHHLHIYRSKRHVWWTLAALVVPFALMALLWSQKIAALPLLSDVGISLVRLTLAYLAAAAIGWLLAVSFYRGRRAIVALPFFDVMQSFPTFAALPLATWAWGKSNFTVIFFLVITIVWPIFFTVISSLKLAHEDRKEATEIYNLRGWDYLKWYLWPLTLPSLVTGSIIGLGEGWEALVATEMIVEVQKGLGPAFQGLSGKPGETAFAILGLLVLIFGINKILWLPLLEWSHRHMDD